MRDRIYRVFEETFKEWKKEYEYPMDGLMKLLPPDAEFVNHHWECGSLLVRIRHLSFDIVPEGAVIPHYRLEEIIPTQYPKMEMCETCKYWRRTGEFFGACCRRPPVVLKLDYSGSDNGRFPYTKRNCWCGEWWTKEKGNTPVHHVFERFYT